MLTLRTVVAASILAACALPPADAEEIPWPFPIRVEHRPGTYWWCPGSALTEADIDWNLQKMREGGIGTAHIVPIYGAKGAEDR